MTISIWRYSHLVLALSSGLFLVLASVTGIILAFEPIQHKIYSSQPVNLSEVSLGDAINAFQTQYDEVLTLEVDENEFLIADVVTKAGESKKIYVHPLTGEELGAPKPQSKLFQFTTNLHRSLFLKGIGRFFVGLVSFLLCLIAITGLLLVIKRQGGLLKLFSKVQKDYFEMRYHVILGRWALVPIIILALTGVYLSAEKFSLLPSIKVVHDTVEPENKMDLDVNPSKLLVFKNIHLDEVRSVSFPFSEFPEDYFEIALKHKELYVHQYTGEILSERPYPFTAIASRWSLVLHTGKGSVLWSIVLLLASASILFFLYSGIMMWRRRTKDTKNEIQTIDKDECSHIILVGSETGNTFKFAKALESALVEAEKKVFVSELNAYSTYKKAEHIIVMTATYGEGESPTNSRKFESLFKQIRPETELLYSVVAFGSLLYPQYCQFGIDVDNLFRGKPGFKEFLPIYKINNQSFEAFKDWARIWGSKNDIALKVKSLQKKEKPGRLVPFEVVQRTELNKDDTYLIAIKPRKRVKFQSGDLLAYTSEKDSVTRLYSIAKVNDHILLSIKRHDYGLVSKQFAQFSKGDTIQASVKRNLEFHFPRYAPEIVCISNGTGIAPFLGIIDENESKKPIHLYWGGRQEESFHIYKGHVEKALKSKKLTSVQIAYSQEKKDKTYVQDILLRDEVDISKKLERGAVFMICGSIAMQRNVLDVLENISRSMLNKSLSEFEHQEQLKMDCY